MIVLVGASAVENRAAKVLCKTKGYKKCVTTTTHDKSG